MDDFIRALAILQDITGETNKLDYPAFGGLWCMMLEEYCKSNKLDIIEASKDMMVIINQVQEEHGRY